MPEVVLLITTTGLEGEEGTGVHLGEEGETLIMVLEAPDSHIIMVGET